MSLVTAIMLIMNSFNKYVCAIVVIVFSMSLSSVVAEETETTDCLQRVEIDLTEEEIAPGSLIVPDQEKEDATKQCLNTCKEWGRDCIINPRTGARRCQRVCKSFGKSCF